MIRTRLVSLNMPMKVLTMPGMTSFSACGSTISPIFCQYEGADSLGLGYWQKMYFVVMPQALKLVIPGIVNTFIGMFKDSSLVSIISMFDLLGIIKQNFSDPNWATPVTAKSGLVFAAFVFWLFCFGMSRYSMYTERRLDTGHKR